MDHKNWPPAPAQTEPSKVSAIDAPPNPPIWRRYGFVLGVVSNLAVILSTVRFFFLPYGSGLDFEDWLFLFVMPFSFLVVVVGSVLSLWEIGKQHDRHSSTTLGVIGLVLNWLPLPLALFLLNEAFSLRRLWDDG
jgi:hypothetical protein